MRQSPRLRSFPLPLRTLMQRADLRNVAIVAHVDHGKTTLVDAMLRQSGAFRANQDGGRPGHGLHGPGAGEGHHHPGQEHRRALRRPDHQHRRHARPRRLRRRGGAGPDHGGRGAAAGRRQRGPAAPDPLRAAQDARGPAAGDLRDQQDRPPRRPDRPRWSTRSTSCSSIWAPTSTRSSSRSSTATPGPARPPWPPRTWRPAPDLKVLFDLLVEHIPAPTYEEGHPFQALVTNLDASPYVGRLALCRIRNGRVKKGDTVAWCRHDGTHRAGPPVRAVRDRGPGPGRRPAGGSRPGRHHRRGRHPRDHDRRHPGRPRRSPAPAGHHHRRAEHRHDPRGQHLAARRQGRRRARRRAPSSRPGSSRTASTPSWSATSPSGSCPPSGPTPGRCRAAASWPWPSWSS